MASVSDFVSDDATVLIEGAGGINLRVRYRPSLISAAGDEKMKRYADLQDTQAIGRFLCDCIVDWDLEGPLWADIPVRDHDGNVEYDEHDMEVSTRNLLVEGGKTIPLEPDYVKYIPHGPILKIYAAIAQDALPDPQTGRGSRKR